MQPVATLRRQTSRRPLPKQGVKLTLQYVKLFKKLLKIIKTGASAQLMNLGSELLQRIAIRWISQAAILPLLNLIGPGSEGVDELSFKTQDMRLGGGLEVTPTIHLGARVALSVWCSPAPAAQTAWR